MERIEFWDRICVHQYMARSPYSITILLLMKKNLGHIVLFTPQVWAQHFGKSQLRTFGDILKLSEICDEEEVGKGMTLEHYSYLLWPAYSSLTFAGGGTAYWFIFKLYDEL